MTFAFNIDFGQVITLVFVILAMIAAYYDTRGELRAQSSRVMGLETAYQTQLDLNKKQLEGNQKVVGELSQIRTDIAVIRERIEAANVQAAENAVKITEAIGKPA